MIGVDVKYHNDLHPPPLLLMTSCNQLVAHLTDNWRLKSFALILSDAAVRVNLCIKVVQLVKYSLPSWIIIFDSVIGSQLGTTMDRIHHII